MPDYKRAMQEAARILRENYVNQPPVDPYLIAEAEGLTVSTVAFPGRFSGYSGYINLASRSIVLNEQDSSNRRRFTVAHEIGHWILHQQELQDNPNIGILTRIPLGRIDSNPMEKEANCFAGNLLVPAEMLQQFSAPEPALLAKVFAVSQDVINFRLVNRKNELGY